MQWIWLTYFLRLLLPLGFLWIELYSSEPASVAQCPFPKISEQSSWQGKARVKALRGLDQFLNWSIPIERTFALNEEKEERIYQNDVDSIYEFSKKFGYFSTSHPIVANVTAEEEDIALVRSLLECVNSQIADLEHKQLLTAEILTKVLAYRDLYVDDAFPICLCDKPVEYVVDIVFNLWQGMPAFGLMPVKNGEGSPILLFRGTDASLDSPRGWASLLSDIDISGPGLTAFHHAQDNLHQWLAKVAKSGKKAKVLGFSLGGALAAYTYLFEHDLMSEEISYAFNAPGLSSALLEQWKELPSLTSFQSYITLDDVIPKIGRLFGTAYELRIDDEMMPLEAHTTLMLVQSSTVQAEIDVAEENLSR